MSSQSAVHPKQQLDYLASVLGFEVDFSDFPKVRGCEDVEGPVIIRALARVLEWGPPKIWGGFKNMGGGGHKIF